MPIRRKTAHVRSCLRQDDLSRFCIYSGNRVDQPLITYVNFQGGNGRNGPGRRGIA